MRQQLIPEDVRDDGRYSEWELMGFSHKYRIPIVGLHVVTENDGTSWLVNDTVRSRVSGRKKLLIHYGNRASGQMCTPNKRLNSVYTMDVTMVNCRNCMRRKPFRDDL